jgi:hypothetical protein
MRKTLQVLAFLFILQIQGYSQGNEPGEIVTDRPDQTESADILQPGYFQLEGGFTYMNVVWTFPNSDIKLDYNTYTSGGLIRIGVFPGAELRIGPSFLYQKFKISDQGPVSSQYIDASGFLPLELGTKIKLTDESKYIPAAAFLFSASIPAISSGDYDDFVSTAEFRIALSKTLTDRFSLGVNLGAEYGGFDNAIGLYTLSLSGEIYKNLGGFVEVYGNFADGWEPSHYVDGGLTYRIMKNLQIDFSAGTLYSDDTSDFFIGGGISVRLPR